MDWEDPLEKEMANPLQCSCLGSPMNRGAWGAMVYRVAKELDMTKQRHYFVNKGLYSQSYGFCSTHVWVCELDHKEI